MLSSQALVSALRPSHPSHAVVTAPSGPRMMKKTLQSSQMPKVREYLNDNQTLNPSDYNKTLKEIHTASVKSAINELGPNPVLDATPPDLNDSEKSLPRPQRCTLAQLRSGQCRLLNDYQQKLGRLNSALCPECLIGRHTVRHIFNCDARPTALTVSDLWENPVPVASFLQTLPSFASFLAPPLPPPPPEPPP